MLKTGIKGIQKTQVSEENTAKAMESGTLDVFATPAMVALMELTAWKSVAPYLEDGTGTVGSYLDIHHNSPTPVGMTVTCESELIQIEGRKLTFRLTAKDDSGIIGEGTHERFLIDNEKFSRKAAGKLV